MNDIHAWPNECHGLQVTGADLQDMDLEELREIVPDCTRVECKRFLRRVRDAEAASQVSGRVRVRVGQGVGQGQGC